MSDALYQNQNQKTGTINFVYLPKLAVLLAAILAFVLPGKVAAQVDCNSCVHGGALLENVFGTNCLGQLVSGKAHAGDTVFVRLIIRNVDCCPNDGSTNFQPPFIDWHLVTNVTDAANFGCSNLQTANLLTNQGTILANQCFDPFDPSTSYAVSNLTFSGQVFAYKYVIPACITCTTNPVSVSHTSASIGRDTNSFCNPNGQVLGGGSAQLNILCPKICVGKQCVNGVGENGSITWTGSVTNCGNSILTNVIVTHFVNGTNQVVVGPTTLTPGQVTNFGGSYMPTNICASSTDSLVAQGTDELVCTVSATATATCSIITTPCLAVTKNCTTVAVGQPQTISGIITNCGNVTLTNIIINDNVVGAITNFASLAPNSTLSYSKTVTAVCGGNTNVVTASANSACGVPVVARATNTCVVTEAPCILVTKNCTTNVVGQPQTISGFVTNCGNVTLTNIVVTDNVVGAVTNISSLAPGAFSNYSKTVTAVCGGNTNVVTASANSACGTPVLARATNTCVVTEAPCIAVTKNCATVVVGQPQTISGFITNCGNVTLTNIVVNDDVVGAITNLSSLAPGVSSNYSKTVTAVCGGNTNVVTASANSACGTPVLARATNTCVVTENPCISVTMNCPPVTNPAPQFVSGSVTNCGNVTLTNITVTDNILGVITNISSLAPNSSVGYSKSNSPNCTTTAHIVTASGNSICGTARQASVTNDCSEVCGTPKICVTKEVACFLGTNAPQPLTPLPIEPGEFCDVFGKNAIGVSGDTQSPAFCYRITVSNCGDVPLTNVTVIDQPFGDLTTNFFATPGTVFPTNGSITYTFKVELDHNLTNTVTVSGKSTLTGQSVTTNDHATVKIIPAKVECAKLISVDGGPLQSDVTIEDELTHSIVWYARVFNTGEANLKNVIVTDVTTNLGCDVTLAPFDLDAGDDITLPLCTNASFVATGGGIVNDIIVSADQFSVGTNHDSVCAHDINGDNILVRSQCSATITIELPNACRTTGGGRQDSPLTFPNNVRYVTHGGQVGAPVGNHVCVVTPTFYRGNPCIHGRWEHVRHAQGGLRGNFHARIYDTLECACLDTNVDVNGVYGNGTVTGKVCNADNRDAGPLPRPAPANKIVFTGIGDYTETNGRRVPRACLFRVDIEDRSEPGGSHPGGAHAPADRYRIRIWLLSAAEQARLNNPNDALISWRNAISACNGINVRDGVDVPNGTPVFTDVSIGFTNAPTIDDGGELERGNHQIHPAIKNCDPNDPTGPGLPKK